jgi:hypothetical protein
MRAAPRVTFLEYSILLKIHLMKFRRKTDISPGIANTGTKQKHEGINYALARRVFHHER